MLEARLSSFIDSSCSEVILSVSRDDLRILDEITAIIANITSETRTSINVKPFYSFIK